MNLAQIERLEKCKKYNNKYADEQCGQQGFFKIGTNYHY